MLADAAVGSRAWQEMVYTWVCLHKALETAAEEAKALAGPDADPVGFVVPSLEEFIVALHLYEEE